MDGDRFDDITRRLAADTSRRSFLKKSLAVIAAVAGAGGATGAGAARRPANPTPIPVRCPGTQVPCGSSCCCPGESTPCGPDCCPAGSQCCDGACCYGTCYGEELCCPTGQLVCDGRCLDLGLCCTNADCPPGWDCGVESPNVCTCVPTITCSASGRNCGSLTDDCGTLLDCGTCQTPSECGGSGTDGVCGCTVTTTCDGKCGDVVTECGTVLSCGNTCGSCQSCTAANTCGPAADGTRCGEACDAGFCAQGNCSVIHTIACPDAGSTTIPDPNQRCNTYQCVQEADGPRCVATPANDGASCEPLDPCQTGTCSQGQCVGTPVDCGTCMECSEGTCQPNTGATCGFEHRCVEGTCSHFPTGTPPLDTDVEAICSQLKCADACCPGPGSSTCCASMDDCFLSDGGGFLNAFCCDPADKCGSDCCWSGESCAGGTVCRPDGMICADNPYCEEACCGGTGNAGSGACCPIGQRCQNGVCTPVPAGSCTSNDDCDSSSICAGLVIDLETGAVDQVGACCLSAYAYINPFASTSAGQTVYGCCAAPLYVGSPDVGAFCCSYTDAQCAGCMCSRTSVRRWGN